MKTTSRLRFGAIFSLSLLSVSISFADATSGAAFLRLGAGARPLALGDAYTAVGGDVDSLYYNPAGLSTLSQPELSLTHSDWFQDTTYDLLSYGQPTAYGTWAVSALRLGGGTEQGYDAFRQPTGTFTSDDIAALISYSHQLGSQGGLGANLKYIRSRIATDSASTFALDLGSQAKWPGLPLQLGVSALNIGSGLRFIDQVDRLPLTFAVGAAARPFRPLMLTLDAKHEPYNQLTTIDAGAEYAVSAFAFRVGYTVPVQGAANDALNTTADIRGGLGVHFSRYQADFTLAPFGDLGLTERITVGIRFGPDTTDHGPHNLDHPKEAERRVGSADFLGEPMNSLLD